MPMISTTPAVINAPVNECVAPTMYPVVTGATTPIILFKKFMMPPMVPVPPRGAISDGIDQPTGAAAAKPAQRDRYPDDCPDRAGGKGSAKHREAEQHAQHTSTVLRTRRFVVATRDQVVDQPAADDEIRNRGASPWIAVKLADFRILMCIVSTR